MMFSNLGVINAFGDLQACYFQWMVVLLRHNPGSVKEHLYL